MFLVIYPNFAAVGVVFTIQSSTPGSSLYSETAVSFGLPYFVISLSLNIILTILIIARLLTYRRRINAVMGSEHGRDYTSLAALIVESAVLYSVFALAFLITYAINNPINQVFIGLVTPVQVSIILKIQNAEKLTSPQLIASYLIIYRVAQGRAWSRDTLTQPAPSSLRFGKSTGASPPTDSDFSRGRTESTFPTSSSEVSHDAVSLGVHIGYARSHSDSDSDLSKVKTIRK